MDSTVSITRSWQDQPLPAPLLPAALAEVLALGLLRQQPDSRGAVGAGSSLIQLMLERAGIPTTLLLLNGPALPAGADVVYQTSPEAAERFDELLSQVLQEPSPVDLTTGLWLRQRTLALLRLKALSPVDTYMQLPEVDAGWQPPKRWLLAPRLVRWFMQATPLLVGSLLLLDAYIWFAGAGPALWPLLVLPLLGSFAFGGLLFARLRAWRGGIAQAWLARPERLRPDAARVARELARAPWALLWLPPLLLASAFLLVITLLISAKALTLSLMLVPFLLALLAQLGVSVWRTRRYVAQTRELVQGLPAGLLPTAKPVTDPTGVLWQTYSYF